MSTAFSQFTQNQTKIANNIVDYQLKQKITLQQSLTRNIIFVGRARCGKSTMFEVLKDSCYVAKPLSIFRSTIEPKLHSFTVSKYFENKTAKQSAMEKFLPIPVISKNEELEKEYEMYIQSVNEEIQREKERRQLNLTTQNSISFNINIIDTPGLFESTKKGEIDKDDKSLKNTILTCMRKEIKKIHAIFFVISFSAGIMKHDIEAFKQFLELFRGAEKNIALVITKCETTPLQQKESLKKQIYKSKALKEILEKLDGNRVFFMGSIDFATYNKGLYDKVELAIKNVSAMREELFEFIFNITEPCRINEIGFVKTRGHNILKDQEKLLNLLKLRISSKPNTPKIPSRTIMELARKVDEHDGFISTERGQEVKEKTTMIFESLNQKVIKQMALLIALLKNPQHKEEEAKEMYEQVKEDRCFIRTNAGIVLFKNMQTHYDNLYKK